MWTPRQPRAGMSPVTYYLLQPERTRIIYQTSRVFQASYLILVDEEEHDEQNLQEEDKQEQDEELSDTKEGKFNMAFIWEEEESTGDDGHLRNMCEVQIEKRVLRLYILEWQCQINNKGMTAARWRATKESWWSRVWLLDLTISSWQIRAERRDNGSQSDSLEGLMHSAPPYTGTD